MVKITKKCIHVMPDGYRCNRPFTIKHQEGRIVTCEEHRGTDRRNKSGLAKSTNAYAQGGNDIKMREWIIDKMSKEHDEGERIDLLEREVKRLTKLVGDVKARKHIMQTEVREIVKELDPFLSNNPELIKINDRLLKIHNRSIKVDKRNTEMLDDWDKVTGLGSLKKATAGQIMTNWKAIKKLYTALGLCHKCGEPHVAKYCPNSRGEEE